MNDYAPAIIHWQEPTRRIVDLEESGRLNIRSMAGKLLVGHSPVVHLNGRAHLFGGSVVTVGRARVAELLSRALAEIYLLAASSAVLDHAIRLAIEAVNRSGVGDHRSNLERRMSACRHPPFPSSHPCGPSCKSKRNWRGRWRWPAICATAPQVNAHPTLAVFRS